MGNLPSIQIYHPGFTPTERHPWHKQNPSRGCDPQSRRAAPPASPGERWVLTWNQQRVEFVHDGSGQMMMRVGQAEDWLEVQPFWTVDQSLCWGSVCATGVIPLE